MFLFRVHFHSFSPSALHFYADSDYSYDHCQIMTLHSQLIRAQMNLSFLISWLLQIESFLALN